MQSTIELGGIFREEIVSRGAETFKAPAILHQPIEQDGVFNRDYARSYDSDMVEALPHLHRIWMTGTKIAADTVPGDGLVLDAGIGTGRVTEAILKRHPEVRVIGIDRSQGFLEVGQERLGKIPSSIGRVSLQMGDLSQPLPFADNTFGGVVSHWVVQYMGRDGQSAFYRETFRVLRPGGRLFLNQSTMPFKRFVPAFVVSYLMMGLVRPAYWRGLKRIWKHISVVKKFNQGYKTGAMYLPSVGETIQNLEKAGFQDVRVVGHGYIPLPLYLDRVVRIPFVAFITASRPD